MILVDIYVPIIELDYDFFINEHVTVETVVDEVVEIVAQKEGCFENRDSLKMSLYSFQTGKHLCVKKNLFQNGIADGDRLLLV